MPWAEEGLHDGTSNILSFAPSIHTCIDMDVWLIERYIGLCGLEPGSGSFDAPCSLRQGVDRPGVYPFPFSFSNFCDCSFFFLERSPASGLLLQGGAAFFCIHGSHRLLWFCQWAGLLSSLMPQLDLGSIPVSLLATASHWRAAASKEDPRGLWIVFASERRG